MTRFPFTAIVGQTDMKQALLCNAVAPGIGGVVISGTRGTAKSTAARSLAGLLPPIQVVSDCPYNCPPDAPERQCHSCTDREPSELTDTSETVEMPFVNLPIGATEDRVLGTIDIETAIQAGERTFEPGLLARANRGILYVDEVNLLGDHIVDVLLDAVATGSNRVEREGVSVVHPASVLLIGTMNPEEGELRPQLLDRFGLYVEAEDSLAPEDRKRVIRRRNAFEDDPETFRNEWADEERALAGRVARARETFPAVTVPDDQLDHIVEICIEAGVDGHRADIVIHRTARALAALDGAESVSPDHVTRAAELALGHRARRTVDPDEKDPGDNDDHGGHDEDRNRPDPDDLPDLDTTSEQDTEPVGSETDDEADASTTTGPVPDEEPDGDGGPEQVFPIAEGVESPSISPDKQLSSPGTPDSAGQFRGQTGSGSGPYTRARRPRGNVSDVALDATLRAAAPHQRDRQATTAETHAIECRTEDLRERVRESQSRNLIVFVLDGSGSMGARRRMARVKGAVLSLLEDAYQRRDMVSLVGFRGDSAETLLAPTTSVRKAGRTLAELPTGGRTPLDIGLARGLQVAAKSQRQRTDLVPHLVVVTDGRSNRTDTDASPVTAALQRASEVRQADVPAMCFDTENGPMRLGLVKQLADHMDATYYHLDDLPAGGISGAIREMVEDESALRD